MKYDTGPSWIGRCRVWTIFVGWFLGLVLPAALMAATVTLSPPSDAYVNDSDPAGNYNNAWLVAGRSPAEFTPRYRSFLRFDLASVPSNALVSSAVLRLNLQAYEGVSAATIGVRRVLASWSSGTLTWNNQPVVASVPAASTAVGTAIGVDYQWTITGLVQDWIEGQFANLGLALVVTNESTAAVTRTFGSSNNTNTTIRPELVVTYALPGDIAVTPPSLSFGNQRVGTTSAVQNVTVLNSGGSVLWISNVTSSSSRFLIEGTPPFPATLAPGASGVFQVRFAPASIGVQNGTIAIASNDPDEAAVAISCSGAGIAPDINVLPSALNFASQLVGSQSVTQFVTIQNTGNADLHITSISSSSGQFLLRLGTVLPATVTPGGSLPVGVQFAPTTTGPSSGTVMVVSDDPDENSRVVSCSGTGVVPDINVLPSALNFASQLVGSQSVTQFVTIQNTGNAELHITSISSSSSQFLLRLGTVLPATVTPGGSLPVGVQFAPTSLGIKSGTVTVASDDSDEATVSVSCTGTGTAPEIEVMPARLDFGFRALGTVAPAQRLTVNNSGGATLVVSAITVSSSEFVLSGLPGLPANVAPGASLHLDVAFVPFTVGTRDGFVVIRSDDADESVVSISCSGTGIRSEIQVRPVQGLEVRLDRLIYETNDLVSASLLVHNGQLSSEHLGLVLAGSKSGDVEVLDVRRMADGRLYTTEQPVRIRRQNDGELAQRVDQVLTLRPGEIFFAIYYTSAERDQAVLHGEDMITDYGMLANPQFETLRPGVIAELAMTDDERVPIPGAKRMGTITQAGGLPVQIATEELILRPRDQRQLNDFLRATGGRIVLTDLLEEERTTRAEPSRYLVRVDPMTANLELLPQLHGMAGGQGKFIASSMDALRISALALEYRLEGFDVGVNPRLQYFDRPRWNQANGQPFRDEIPQSFSHRLFRMPKAWSFMALWDQDTNRIPVAFLDQGFSTNSDFRTPLTECDMEGGSLIDGLISGFSCGPGQAQAPPTVGNSFFNERSWHGNGVVTVAGGIVNNGYGCAGTGGQVVVPMLYRFGLASYAFEVGLGIRKATLDGAAVINISAGYPCRVVTDIGNQEICSFGGRLEFCTLLTESLTVAAATVCAAAAAVGAIPIVGPALAADLHVKCIEANLAVVAGSTACYATLIEGDVRGTMEEGVAFALERGVPVVASAGNKLDRDDLPPVVRDILDLDNIDVGDWQMIPATIDGVICVAAARDFDDDGEPFWANAHFRGDRVDIWGPIRSRYMAPRDLDAVEPDPALHEAKWIGGTSAAAPYISGLIADMMALDPSLHPLNPALTANQLRAIPQRVRDLLVNTAWTQDELEDRGFLDLDAPVRNLVRPPAALRRAAEAAIPLVNFGMLGFTDDEINFGETALVDRMDFPLWAHDLGVLDAQREFSHTILTLPGELPSGVEFTDVDWISYTMPEEIVWLTDPFGISRPQIRDGYYNAIIQLLTPATFGELTIEGDGVEEVSRGTESPHPLVTLREFRTPLLFNNATANFQVRNDGAGSDNWYIVRALPGEWVAPPPLGDRFDQDNDENRDESRPNNDAPFRAVHLGDSADEFAWQTSLVPGGVNPVASVITIPNLSFHFARDEDWFQLVNLPPFEFFDPPGCRPVLEVECGPGLVLEVYEPDNAELLHSTLNSPATIPADYVFEGMLLRLRPVEPRQYLEYTLTLTFRSPLNLLCELAGIFGEEGGGGWPGGAGGGGAFLFPRYRTLVTDVTELARFRRGFAEVVRDVDEQGRVTTPDLYVFDWNGDGAFQAVAALDVGDSIRLRVFSMEGTLLGDASLGGVMLAALSPAPTRDQLGRPYLVLNVPSLPTGSYVLAISHGRPGTRLEVFLSAGATTNDAVTSEDYWQHYFTTGEEEPALGPRIPIVLSQVTPGPGTVRFSFLAESGLYYHVEAADSLSAPRWQVVRSVEGAGQAVIVHEPTGTGQRFYRVRAE